MNSYYPDDVSGSQLCMIEGCIGETHCGRCGRVNYAYLGYKGAIGRLAKLWGCSKEEVEARRCGKAGVCFACGEPMTRWVESAQGFDWPVCDSSLCQADALNAKDRASPPD